MIVICSLKNLTTTIHTQGSKQKVCCYIYDLYYSYDNVTMYTRTQGIAQTELEFIVLLPPPRYALPGPLLDLVSLRFLISKNKNKKMMLAVYLDLRYICYVWKCFNRSIWYLFVWLYIVILFGNHFITNLFICNIYFLLLNISLS